MAKPSNEFYVSNKARCKECKKLYGRQRYAETKEDKIAGSAKWRSANPEASYWAARKSRWRAIGIADVDTLEWVDILESQQYRCKVCGAPIDIYSAHRDHDHETGLTRAAVCSTECNMAMDKES